MTEMLRVGSVPYLVGRPLDYGLENDPEVRFSKEVPARLVEGLREGRLDVALVSSIELFRMPGYSYLPGLCVGGRGVVSSVQVFLRRPLDEVESVAMDPASRTSQALVQILLADRPDGPPEYLFPALGEDHRKLASSAWLSIGDRALRDFHAGGTQVFNPSDAWTRTTGLPFVFAAWIVRPGVDIAPHRARLERAHERGRAAIGQLAGQAARTWNLPAKVCEDYLGRECVYRLGPEMDEALKLFGERAGALGLTHPEAIPEPVQA
ncbi:MAG: menaquinone biosynthesis protein [Planctomycetes bacterium]|nr:menaquinone biosynthesis protein [Planctomycetota bacterium]MCB9911128.1 menaquinone biosynthesis protein [Planctomycetota bacterium]MCB9912139.1 menaquinone biosynthesis protein [Planctomycetota bacterium]HPF13754.1 menaquinone biosynthesis protein [Planctomycetota bacterium]HRV81333.1 menaquinone biosynthesis protein [Planctomycetota bacterium]